MTIYRRRPAHICMGFDEAQWSDRRPTTDRHAEGCAAHTPCPDGYVQWHEWAEWINKTHRNVACPDCGKFAIWVPRNNHAFRTYLAGRVVVATPATESQP